MDVPTIIAQTNWGELADPANLTTGIALMIVIPYAVVTWFAFQYPSPAVMVAWTLTTGFLIVTFLTELGLVTFWLALVLLAVLVGISAMLGARK